MNRRFFREEQIRAVKRQISVDLIRGNLMIASDAVFSGCVHQYGSPDNIRLQEDFRAFNASVHVAFRREVDDDFRLFLREQCFNPRTVADVQFDKTEVRLIHHRSQRTQISRVGQFIQTDYPVFRMFPQPVKDKVASDKSGSAGYDNGHGLIPFRAVSATCPDICRPVRL